MNYWYGIYYSLRLLVIWSRLKQELANNYVGKSEWNTWIDRRFFKLLMDRFALSYYVVECRLFSFLSGFILIIWNQPHQLVNNFWDSFLVLMLSINWCSIALGRIEVILLNKLLELGRLFEPFLLPDLI